MALASVSNQGLAINPYSPAVKARVPCCGAIRRCFENLSSSFHRSYLGLFYRKCLPYSSLIRHSANLVSNVACTDLFNVIVRKMGKPHPGSLGNDYQLLSKVIQNAKILKVVSIPFALTGIGVEICKAVQNRDKTEPLLRIAKNLGWLGDSVAAFVGGLHAAGAVVANVSAWTLSFYGAGAFLSLASCPLAAWGLRQSCALGDEIRNIAGSKGSEGVIQHLLAKDNRFLRKHFRVEGKKLRCALQKIPAEKAELTVAALQKRIQVRQWSHRLTVISSVITWLGMMILIFTPLFAFAYALMAVASIISISKFIYDRKSKARFAAALKL